jgi:hypothetical protein
VIVNGCPLAVVVKTGQRNTLMFPSCLEIRHRLLAACRG